MRKPTGLGLMASIALVAITGCSAAAEEGASDSNAAGEEIAAIAQPAQWNMGGRWQIDTSNASQVAGYFQYKMKAGNAWPTCGLTFVSRHFAITASHCVPDTDFRVDNDTVVNTTDDKLTVLQFDARNIVAANGGAWQALQRLYNAAQVTGTWPNYTRGPGLSCGVGYCITMADFDCRVRYRCKGTGSNCPAAIQGEDLAMVHCPNRPSNYPYATVATTAEAIGTPIDVHWYHELVDMPSEATDAVGPADAFAHYTMYDTSFSGTYGKTQNYHYQRPGQFMPLFGGQFPTGEHYKVIGMSANSASSDAFVCHGTSGSGVFLANTTTLLGPMLGGGSLNRLCQRLSDSGPGRPGGGFERAVKTRVLEQLVTWDR